MARSVVHQRGGGISAVITTSERIHSMPRSSARRALLPITLLILLPALAPARPFGRGFSALGLQDFRMLDTPVSTSRGAREAHETPPVERLRPLRGRTIAALDSGSLIIDGDSGQLIRANPWGSATERLFVGHDAAQLIYIPPGDHTETLPSGLEDAGLALVSDRLGDRIAVIAVGRELTEVRQIATDAEPYALAVTSDRSTLLVTAIADRTLSAYDIESGRRLWSLSVPAEPRGLALSPDGTRAVITFLTSSAVARLQLLDNRPPRVRYTSLNRYHRAATPQRNTLTSARPSQPGQPPANAGRSHARAAFSATYLSDDLVVVPFQQSTPTQAVREISTDVYGGTDLESPIRYRLAFLVDRDTDRARAGQVALAKLGLHQPRAMLYEQSTDTLYLASHSVDALVALKGASTPAVTVSWIARIGDFGTHCGPRGLSLDPGGKLLVHCGASRSVASLEPAFVDEEFAHARSGPALARSRLTESQRRGRDLFTRSGQRQLSMGGAFACTSCHYEGRTDGLSWSIGGGRLQTPVLAGRVRGTRPYKWDGSDATIQDSLKRTITRLGGFGLSEQQQADLIAYLRVMPRPRTPTVDRDAVRRGRQAFTMLGCDSCHEGAALADSSTYDFASSLPQVNTPSLIGVSLSAPYFHDGSAATLRAVLLENGTIHGMSDVAELTPARIDDLVAYLNSL